MKKTKGIIFLQRAIDTEGVEAHNFNEQFKKIEPHSSKIEIRINCSGGSILHGWSMVDTIQNSSVPVTGIVTGVAASMASVIFAACHKRIMVGHANLMMHNPRNGDPQHVEAYTDQLIKFYSNAFSMKKFAIEKLMNGVKGSDGTWLDAEEAKGLGMIDEIKPVGLIHTLKNPFKEVCNSKHPLEDSSNLIEAMVDVYESMEVGTFEKTLAKLDMMQNLLHSEINARTITGALQQIEESQLRNQR